MRLIEVRSVEKCEEADALLADFLKGSEVLDRKKREIKQVVRGLLGLIFQRGHLVLAPTVIRYAEVFEWHLLPDAWRAPKITAQFMVGGAKTYVYSSEVAEDPYVQYVERVHTALPLLVHGLTVAFPELLKAFQPFVAAARSTPR